MDQLLTPMQDLDHRKWTQTDLMLAGHGQTFGAELPYYRVKLYFLADHPCNELPPGEQASHFSKFRDYLFSKATQSKDQPATIALKEIDIATLPLTFGGIIETNDFTDSSEKEIIRLDIGKFVTAGLLAGQASPPPVTSASKPVQAETEKAHEEQRYQWLNCVYDDTFYAGVVYEMELQWMVCSGGLVADFIASLTRRAKLAGFLLNLVPTLEHYEYPLRYLLHTFYTCLHPSPPFYAPYTLFAPY